LYWKLTAHFATFNLHVSMKKIALSFFFLLTAAFLSAGSIEYTYYYNTPSVKQTGDFHAITFENTFLTGKTGEPALPYQAVKLLLPAGEEAISVIWKFENEEAIEGNFLLYPQQPSRPYSVGSDGVFHQNHEIYESENTYPSVAWGEYSTHFLNGHSFLLASFTPVKYIPANGRISFYGKVTVTVETRATEKAMTAFLNISNNTNTNKRIKELAQNESMLGSYPERSTREGEYQILIIAPLSFAITLQQLEELYLIRGYKTEIASVETISTEADGQDLQEKIRNYIIGEYQQHGIEHVLLAGDDEHIPHRGFYCHVQSSIVYEDWDIPADLYYSALDGNWNNDGDESWAEIGEDDLLPDVSVARFPVSNASQLQRILHKTISYQDTPVLGELQNVLMAGEQLWSDPLTYGEDYLELLIGYQDENGYITDGMPEDNNYHKLYDSEAGWDKWALINSINQGKSFVHHSGHANEFYVMRLDMQDITNDNFSSANGIDHNYTLMYTHGCLCGAFNQNDCIGEAMVLIDNCAVAGAFNSRYGWFNEGQTEGPSAHLHREFVDALYHDKECRIGAAHMISKIETSVWVNAPGQWEEGALRWCFYDCNIFGDPALGVWTDEPISIIATYPGEIYPGETSVPVNVTSNGNPVEGLMCVIMTDGEMSGCCATDSAGNAVVSVPGGFEGVEFAELVVSGYNCLPNHNTLNIVVGLDEPAQKNMDFTARPNPFSSTFKLSLTLDQDSQAEINFYLQSGQLLEQLLFDGKKGTNEIEIDAATWPVGTIEARIITGSVVRHAHLLHTGK
jgi:hypothetical protein